MSPVPIILAALAGAIAPTAAPAAPPTLAALRWHQRVLILFAPAPSDPGLRAQDGLLAADPAGLGSRDLHVVRIVGDSVSGLAASAGSLRQRFGVDSKRFALRLVGKDGSVAMAEEKPLPASQLFATIDAMPMRRDEMRRAR